ncbi:DciA family protein [Spirochaeta thermophila]|uniref:DUF721 domain-containing protein n=1 Tax=Winmispira thermophila (strain ATCC 49972 / DSM 6192 / RI 19.B1) TaxID=665571 RepID=E0RTB4_WINT6|nr:DciA family protein [Spirochaeta thermophila]ADN00980.1 hypothetical protein STHERM_c00040 [Spirochaeta thermophila DSM 6192]
MKRASELVRALLSHIAPEQGEMYLRFFHMWRRILGERLAYHCRIEDVEKGVVKVVVDHPAWLAEVHFKERYILSRLQKDFPSLGIRRLEFRVEPTMTPRSSQDQVRTQSSEGTEPVEVEEIHATETERIKDPHLREALERLRKTLSRGL